MKLLTKIEDFTSSRKLIATQNGIAPINLQDNFNLDTLSLAVNKLLSIDISNNITLVLFDFTSNRT